MTFTLTGLVRLPDGSTAHQGTARVTTLAPIKDLAGNVVMTGSVQQALSAGSFSFVLPDDSLADAYRLDVVTLSGAALDPITFAPGAPSTTLDLSDMVSTDVLVAVPDTATAATTTALTAETDARIAADTAEANARAAAVTAETNARTAADAAHVAAADPHPGYALEGATSLSLLGVTDMNSVTTPGVYYRGTSTSPPTNWPVTGFAGHVIVSRYAPGDYSAEHIIQRAISARTTSGTANSYQRQYVRTSFSTEGWGPWLEVPLIYHTSGTPADLRNFTGAGTPEGVVTAAVGSRYVDTAATNGAVEWIKASGTGNTGWKVAYGDTGQRNVVADSAWINAVTDAGGIYTLKAGEVYTVRRVGQTVSVEFALDKNLTGSATTVSPWPSGWRPKTFGRGVIVLGTNSGMQFHRLYVGGGTNQNSYANVVAGTAIGFSAVWLTDDPWPSSLPGTAA